MDEGPLRDTSILEGGDAGVEEYDMHKPSKRQIAAFICHHASRSQLDPEVPTTRFGSGLTW